MTVTPPGMRPQGSATLERDAALTRVGWTRRLIIGGSAVLSGAFAWLVSTSPPGKAHAATSPRTTPPAARSSSPPTSSSAPALPPLDSPSQLGLQGPDSNPAPAGPSEGDGGSGASSGDNGSTSGSPDSSGSAGSSGGSSGPTQSAAPAPAPAPAPQPQAPVVSGGS